jgi:hypothetical protein
MKIALKRVEYMPKELQPGVLYVAEHFGAAAHLCACGCGSTIRTPLGPTDWKLQETKKGPTLHPSIGNWQLPCQSHYLIRGGEVKWAEKWTPEQIGAGRRLELDRAKAYYDELDRRRGRRIGRFVDWIRRFFSWAYPR